MTGGKATEWSRAPEWPEEDRKQLERLWSEGYSASEIGRMTNRTRNSIIGKAHRLELAPRRANPIVRPKGLSAVKKVGNGHRQTNLDFSVKAKRNRKPRPPTVVVHMTDITPLNGVGVTILELNRDRCHAVIKEHVRRTSELARYCGNPVFAEGESYCAGHYTAFHQPPRPR